MKLIDVLGMATARNKWNTCSLNEFRKFLNLKPFTTFEGELEQARRLMMLAQAADPLFEFRRMEL